MNVDVEMALPVANKLTDSLLPEGYFIEERGTRKKALFLRGSFSVGERIDETVSRFLFGLHTLGGHLRALNVSLRIGVFYDLNETVIFPFQLSAATLEKIAELGLSLDATIYVCGEDDEEPD